MYVSVHSISNCSNNISLLVNKPIDLALKYKQRAHISKIKRM